MINYCHPACNIPCSLDLGQWMLSWWWAHKSHPFPTQSTHESWNLNVQHFRLRSELLWPSVPLSLPSETPDEWQQEQLYYCSPPPVQKLPGRRQTHIKPCQRWGRRRLPPLGELHRRRHQNQLWRACGSGHPRQGQQDPLCFMTPVRAWSQQHLDLGGYTLPKASAMPVYTARLLYDPGFVCRPVK